MAEPARHESRDAPPEAAPPLVASAPPPCAPGDSVTALAGDVRRYRHDGKARRPPLRIRSVRAYWTTFRVIGSYLWLRLRMRFHSDAWIEHTLRTTHLR